MKILSFEAIQRLDIPPATCYEWASEMIARKNEVLLPPKISMKPAEGVFCNVMPCILPDMGDGSWGGVKVVTRYPGRQPSLDSKLLLFRADTGVFAALMDANWITAMRTGAVAAHSIKLFGKTGFSTLGLIGLGNTARATLKVLAAILPERKFTVKLLRYKGQEETFRDAFLAQGITNYRFLYADTPQQVIDGSDVVISAATYLDRDLCEDRFFAPGVLVVPIHTRGFTNCDLFFDKVFADDYGHVCHFKNFDRFRSFAEVSAVVRGEVPGRENDAERILAYNIGVSMHDIHFAARVYQMCAGQPLPEIDLQEPAEKFWL